MQALWSTSGDVSHNLALEDWWLDRFDALGPVLLFYVNRPAIVVGKNQNPWRETATDWARRAGVPVARRVSGGGAVYHDTGNLNFSLIVPRTAYRPDGVFEQTVAAVADAGVTAALSGGNSLVASGRKISGTAFCFRGAAALHHGTVLVRADLERLRAAMRPAIPELETRAIASRPAPVCNVTDLQAGATVETLAAALAFHLAGAGAWIRYEGPADALFAGRLAHHRSPDWVFGHTPAFAWTLSCGRLEVERGRVARVSGGVPPDAWPGLPFERNALLCAAPPGPWRDVLSRRDW